MHAPASQQVRRAAQGAPARQVPAWVDLDEIEEDVNDADEFVRAIASRGSLSLDYASLDGE